MKTLLLLFFCFTNLQYHLAQAPQLQSGPMVSYSTMKECLIWVQTTQPAPVYIQYWDLKAPNNPYKTAVVTTQKANGLTAHLIADQLEPGKTYAYEVYLNNQKVARDYPLRFQSQPLWQWRTNPPTFSFATGSCAFINEKQYDRKGPPYGGAYQIFQTIHQKGPDFMLWLGDNTYLREADWNSQTGIWHRYTHTRSTPELQPLLGNVHHYAIWDDHDYGPNNSDRSFHMKRQTTHAFQRFFPNNNYAFDEGTTSYFQWADCDFFLLDNRYWRAPNDRTDLAHHPVLGEAQIEWLLDRLASSPAPFKFVAVGGQFLSPIPEGERLYHCAPQERLKIIEGIRRLNINGVIFLTGDVHHTELSQLDIGYPLYDLTVSPLTSGPHEGKLATNPLQVSGTLVQERNYAHLAVSGPRKARKLTVTVYDSDGKLLWERVILAKDLKF